MCAEQQGARGTNRVGRSGATRSEAEGEEAGGKLEDESTASKAEDGLYGPMEYGAGGVGVKGEAQAEQGGATGKSPVSLGEAPLDKPGRGSEVNLQGRENGGGEQEVVGDDVLAQGAEEEVDGQPDGGR